ncbi:MAG: recombinase family protein [Myxococcales bacterium]|nr:recombinase family protein [Myxococcales bacterium]
MLESKRCAIYARKSTTAGLEQEFNSLDAQRTLCLAHIAQQPGWRALDTAYEDGGFTGANLERPAFTRLMQDIDAGLVDVVVVYKVDRLSRSLSDFTRCIDALTKAGVAFVSVTERFSTADAMGRLTMNLLASFAEFERGMVSERTRDKIRSTRKRGLWTGGSVPIGYRSENKKLRIDEPQAALVRRAFALFLQHRRIALVARFLESEGYPPPPTRGRKPAKRWPLARLGGILRNPLYTGRLRCGDEWVRGEHPPIVDQATFQTAQNVIASATTGPRGAAPTTDVGYLLRGLLRCGGCGAAMVPSSTKSRGTVHRYYRCATRLKVGSVACAAALLPAAEVERMVVEHLQASMSSPKMKAQVAAALRADLAARRAAAASLRAGLARTLASEQAQAQALAQDAQRGGADALAELRAGLQDGVDPKMPLPAQLAAVEQELALLEEAAQDVERMIDMLDHFPLVWKHMTLEARWRLLGAIVDRVVVREDARSIEVLLLAPAVSPASDSRRRPGAA